MATRSSSWQGWWGTSAARSSFWLVLGLFAVTAALHYMTPQMRPLPLFGEVALSRHAIERIVFILLVAIAASSFRQKGGLLALIVAVLIMLPRAIWISPAPLDALAEIVVITAVGGLVVGLIEAQAREKELRRRVAERLSAVQSVTAIVTRSLELDRILTAALDKVLEVIGMDVGLILTLDRQSQELILAVHHGLPEASVAALRRVQPEEGVWGQVVQSGECVVVYGDHQDLVLANDLLTQVAVPLKSKEQVEGVLVAGTPYRHEYLPEELELLSAIGGEIGVAVENARLYDRLRLYGQQITRAQEEERQRIAHGLHDETIQTLLAISRRLEGLATLPEPLPEAAQQQLGALQEMIGDAMRGMRRVVQNLRPPALEHLGLLAAIRGLVRELRAEHGLETELAVTGKVSRLPPECELALFRIAQEALNNVRQHAGAARASVRLAFGPGSLRMTIQDDGCGFAVPRRMDDLLAAGKLGLAGMEERVRALGGTLSVRSEPGRGTTVCATMPLGSRLME